MKKGKLKKILATSAMGIMALAMPFTLTGCDESDNTLNPQNFRVQDGWVQHTDDGEKWTNLFQTEQSASKYDFRIHEGYVQWTTDGETWSNLIEAEYPISEYDFRVRDGFVQWTTDGEIWTNLIKTEEKKTYTVTYDYGAAKYMFSRSPEKTVVAENTWLNGNMPDSSFDGFIGWFIKGADKQITEYDYIAGDIALEARFDFEKGPSGLYHNGKYVKTWQQMLDDEDIVVVDGVLVSASDTFGGDLSIDNSIIEIGDGAFKYPNGRACGITGVKIPYTVTKIGQSSFYGCVFLTNVKISEGVLFIEDTAFYNCQMTSITIPSSVLKVDYNAFAYCRNLFSVSFMVSHKRPTGQLKIYNYDKEVISPDAYSLTDTQLLYYLKNGYLFAKVSEVDGCEYTFVQSYFNDQYGNYDGLILISVSKIITEIDLIQAIEIDVLAFSGCENLTSVIIPESVMSIGFSAFDGCINLTTITFEEKEGYKWQVYENYEWRDAQESELFDFATMGNQLRRVAE